MPLTITLYYVFDRSIYPSFYLSLSIYACVYVRVCVRACMRMGAVCLHAFLFVFVDSRNSHKVCKASQILLTRCKNNCLHISHP